MGHVKNDIQPGVWVTFPAHVLIYVYPVGGGRGCFSILFRSTRCIIPSPSLPQVDLKERLGPAFVSCAKTKGKARNMKHIKNVKNNSLEF